jgi:DNA-binding GntR family transcriptional regulator
MLDISVVHSLADRAHQEIRRLIVSLELPPGAVIDERALVGRLGMSRTPVREALRRLAQERLVEVYPRRGMFVTPVDLRELARLSEVRAVLEPEAARWAAERASEAEREEIARLLEEIDGHGDAELMDLDERIHRTIYKAAHNEHLAATLEQYFVLALRMWSMAGERANDLVDAVEAHGSVLEAILDEDGDRAASAMRGHVINFENAMHRVLLNA